MQRHKMFRALFTLVYFDISIQEFNNHVPHVRWKGIDLFVLKPMRFKVLAVGNGELW
jgi:hypothetical protein